MYQHDDEFDDDRELPDASDMDRDGDDEQDETEPCPYCQRPVYAEAAHCPHCGIEISWKRLRSGRPIWMVLAIALCLLLVLIFFIF